MGRGKLALIKVVGTIKMEVLKVMRRCLENGGVQNFLSWILGSLRHFFKKYKMTLHSILAATCSGIIKSWSTGSVYEIEEVENGTSYQWCSQERPEYPFPWVHFQICIYTFQCRRFEVIESWKRAEKAKNETENRHRSPEMEKKHIDIWQMSCRFGGESSLETEV